MFAVSMAFAQQKVTGVVIESETGEPVVGASVIVKGANGVGAATDINGKFTIANVPSNAKTLTVSYIGMKSKDVTIKPNLKVYLDSDAKALSEQIVIAYGTATKESFTGSAKVVGAESIAETQKSNALDALTGKVAGVQMYSASGQPGGSSPTIRIRGISSINAGNSPLIVLDGAPYDGDMNNINPADIESMTVLKDAASNALYGARGANGVIMITTKKAKVGENAQITVDAKWGSNSRSVRRYETINDPRHYYETYYTGLKNLALSNGMDAAAANTWANANLINGTYGLQYQVYTAPVGQDLIGTNGKFNPNATSGYLKNGNWLQADDYMDAVYKHGLRQEYNVTATQATTAGNFYASFGYLNNEGITANSDYQRVTARLKADSQLKKFLKVGANFDYAHYDAHYMAEDGVSNSSGNIFAYATQIAPIYPLFVRDADGQIMKDIYGYTVYDYGEGDNAGIERPYMPSGNAVGAAILDVNQYDGNAFNGNMFAEIKFYEDLKFTTSNSLGLDETRSTTLTNGFYGSYASSNGLLGKSHGRNLSTTFTQTLDWGHNFNGHQINAMFGHESHDYRYYYLYAGKSNMFSPDNLELDGAVTDGSSSSYTTRYNTEGWIFRAMYNWNEKYFGSFSFRRDASSRFAKNNRWGNFYSFGGAWLIHKEAFFDVDWVDMLKFKISYGENGNDAIGNYRYTNVSSIANSIGHVGAVPSSRGKDDISWEKVGNFNFGLEFELFGSRFNGSVEFFRRKTSDMLAWFTLPGSYGYTGYYANIGDMTNTGVELDLDADIIRTKDITWNVNANITTYRNRVTYLPEDKKTITTFDGTRGYSSGDYFYGEGKALYTFYIPEYAGVYKPGNYAGDEADVKAALGQSAYGAEYDESLAGSSMWYTTKTVKVLDENGQPVKDENGVDKTKDVRVKTTSYSDAKNYLVGTALPDFYGGFGTSFRYKDFDASINFGFQIGGKCYDSDYATYMTVPYNKTSTGTAFHADMLKAWSVDNQDSNIPRLQYGDEYAASRSSRFLINASYLSINNINVGYTVPKSLTRKLGIAALRVYASADNVCVWSKRQGLDPRQSMSGSVTNSYYAPIRAISGGLTVTF